MREEKNTLSNFYLSLDLQTTITFDLELRLPHRLWPRVHREELYKTHYFILEVSYDLISFLHPLISNLEKSVDILGSFML